MPEVLGLVTARGGSRDVPRKAVADLGGRPVIAWSVEAAARARSVTRIVTSTDDAEIAEAARAAGSEVPFLRPPTLATDHSAHILAVEHALDWLRDQQGYAPDYVALLQPTSPLRTGEDIDAAIALAVETGADAVAGVSQAKTHPAMLKDLRDDGTLVDHVPGPRPAYVRRQDLPPVYVVNGAIFVNLTASLRRDRMFVPPGARAYVMPPDRAIDIDTVWDLELARLVVASRAARR